MGEDEMIDVIGGLKAVVASSNVAKSTGSLVNNLFDPITKEMGNELARWYHERRRRNIIKVAESAERKLASQEDRQGRLSLKTFQEILDGGAVAEDELATEYFGGVLASSLSGVDRDDRGATLAKLVAQLSVYQLRTHYLIYSEIKRLYDGNKCELGTDDGRDRLRIYISYQAYESALELSDEETVDDILLHATYGLLRNELVDAGNTAIGGQELLRPMFPDVPDDGMIVAPSGFGVELFLWAQGLGRILPSNFLDPEVTIPSDISLPVAGPILAVGLGDIQAPGRRRG